jgi:hypothetical protein
VNYDTEDISSSNGFMQDADLVFKEKTPASGMMESF